LTPSAENIRYLQLEISDKYLAYITDGYCANPTSRHMLDSVFSNLAEAGFVLQNLAGNEQKSLLLT